MLILVFHLINVHETTRLFQGQINKWAFLKKKMFIYVHFPFEIETKRTEITFIRNLIFIWLSHAVHGFNLKGFGRLVWTW